MKWSVYAVLFCCFSLACEPVQNKVAEIDHRSLEIDTTFQWPDGINAAVSLTFDDARFSQIDTGIAILDSFNTKASFYISIWSAKQRIEGWTKARANGHEIGNHTLHHPCSANFDWSREYVLESMHPDEMQFELEEANRQIMQIGLGQPKTFAYPCGQKYIGQGKYTQSYVPLVAQTFSAGRGWHDEAPNNPQFCDLAQVLGMSFDAKDFDEIKRLVDQAIDQQSWLVLAGHEIGTQGLQTTRVDMLMQLLPYIHDPAKGIWVAPLHTIAEYVSEQRIK